MADAIRDQGTVGAEKDWGIGQIFRVLKKELVCCSLSQLSRIIWEARSVSKGLINDSGSKVYKA
jgi:hypothetical protein